jgi:hypothetical protein
LRVGVGKHERSRWRGREEETEKKCSGKCVGRCTGEEEMTFGGATRMKTGHEHHEKNKGNVKY